MDVPCPFTDSILGKQDYVAPVLMILLRVEMIHVMFKAMAVRAFSEKDPLRDGERSVRFYEIKSPEP